VEGFVPAAEFVAEDEEPDEALEEPPLEPVAAAPPTVELPTTKTPPETPLGLPPPFALCALLPKASTV